MESNLSIGLVTEKTTLISCKRESTGEVKPNIALSWGTGKNATQTMAK